MGKKSKYPNYSTGSITVNGNTVASTQKDKNGINSSYNMSAAEKNIYNGIQNNLATSLNNLFEISDEKQKQWNSELEAFKKTGIKNINDIYTPIETNLKNDIASRFGNFDNSIFMDNLNEITDKKADAIASLSDALTMRQQELYSTEMANRINYITLLSNLNSIMNNNILNYTSAAMTNAESGNNYNAHKYQADMARNNAMWNTLGEAVNFAGTAVSTFNPGVGNLIKAGSKVVSNGGQFFA